MFLTSHIRIVLVSLLLAGGVVGSCTADDSTDSAAAVPQTAPAAPPAPGVREAQPTQVAGANVFVDVSNQSFDDPDVHITMRVADLTPIDASFPVEGQHHWVGYQLRLAPGDHALEFTSDSGAAHTVEITVPDDAPVYVFTNYWADAETPPHFQSGVSDEPFAYG